MRDAYVSAGVTSLVSEAVNDASAVVHTHTHTHTLSRPRNFSRLVKLSSCALDPPLSCAGNVDNDSSCGDSTYCVEVSKANSLYLCARFYII